LAIANVSLFVFSAMFFPSRKGACNKKASQNIYRHNCRPQFLACVGASIDTIIIVANCLFVN
jgi:hypothetical protein